MFRAVTAIQRDRDGGKKSTSQSDFLPTQLTGLSLRTRKQDRPARQNPSKKTSVPSKEVGFIAMLFQVLQVYIMHCRP